MNNKIAEYREKIGVTQIQMASKLDITNDYLSMIERGARTPGFRLAKKIADYFNASIDEIFFSSEPNEMFAEDEEIEQNEIN